ncbi:hypothetical protein ILUMI_15884, partial [Ignelater luminosus]
SPIRVKTAKANEILHATHTGDIKLMYIEDSIRNTISCTDILVVPELDYNLISVRRLDQKGVKFIFFNGVASAYLQEKLLFKAVASYKMYEVQFEFNQKIANVAKDDDIYLWHRRHIGARSLKALPDLVDGITIDKKKLYSPLNCYYCIEGKQSRLPHVKPRVCATRALQLIHSDVMGPISPTYYDSKRYVVTFIDDWSHFTTAYIMKYKSEILPYFKVFEAMATAHFGTKISRLRCDQGGEYVSKDFVAYCSSIGCQIEYTMRYTASQNGVAEHMNYTIFCKVRCMILNANISKTLWSEAVMAAVYIINRSPTVALDKKTPAEMWFNVKPNLQKLK